MPSKFTILGAGNGGQAFAGVLAAKGFDVTLWNRTYSITKKIKKHGGIELTGVVEGFFENIKTAKKLRNAIKDTDVIMVVTPANAHANLAEKCARYLENDQIIVLNPGRTGGALEFHNILHQHEADHRVTVAEAQTLIYVSRALEPGSVELRQIKKACPVAAIPAFKTSKVVQELQQLHEEFIPAANVLETGLNNIGAIFHPTPLILNAARAECPDECYDHYLDGISPSVGAFLERLDAERVTIAEHFGVKTQTAIDWLCDVYGGSPSTSLYEGFRSVETYDGIGAPAALEHRYIFEDVPTGLVPLSSFGRLVGVPTPIIDSIVNLISAFFHRDFWLEGRTTSQLGIADMNAGELITYVETGMKQPIEEFLAFQPLIEEWSHFEG
ncbi:MAG: NAD/NADP octopine/nopaline dehydrogenase family protein [Candidatus Heimdallarchaeota archaeon]